MPNTGYVRKADVKWLITGLVLLGIFLNGIGLELVKRDARDYATRQATRATLRINEAKRNADLKIVEAKREADRRQVAANTYQTNYTACGLRSIINPGIKVQQQTLNRSLASSRDLSLPESVRKRSAQAAKDAQKAIDNAIKVRDIFGTVPHGFNCKKLPKKPPTGVE